MREFLTVIGLVVQLAASFLLVARGFTEEYLQRVWLAEQKWQIALLPGLFSTVALIACSMSGVVSEHWRSAVLFLMSLVTAACCLPILAKHSLHFVDRVGSPRKDREIETLNRHGVILLAIGFAISALAAVI
jgi:hypothetical protein